MLKLAASFLGAIVAAVVVAMGSWHFYLQHSSSNWPEGTMTVSSSKVTQKTRVDVRYSFEVDGKTYSDKRQINGGFAPATSRHPEILKQYARGTTHPVYYYPSDPGYYSVIEPGGSLPQLACCLVMILFVPRLAINAFRHAMVLKWKLE